MLEAIFSFCSILALSAWLGLIVAAFIPDFVQRRLMWVCGRLIPTVLCIVYASLLISYWGASADGGFHSLAAVQALFAVQGKMLGAWVHFLAFDLFVGHWMLQDTLSGRYARIPLVFALVVTFLYGPSGVLCYLLSRGIARIVQRITIGPR